LKLLLPEDLVADEHVAHAAGDQHLGLADLLHALADRAMRDLLQRDRRRFVRLGMRAHAHTRLFRELRHLGEVALEGVEVDDEGRRVDLVDGRADVCGRKLHVVSAGSRWLPGSSFTRMMGGARACPCAISRGGAAGAAGIMRVGELRER
jgi:hypothetical protein